MKFLEANLLYREHAKSGEEGRQSCGAGSYYTNVYLVQGLFRQKREKFFALALKAENPC
jgi:hypothetical protein